MFATILPFADYTCPDCGQLLDSPRAACSSCGYDPLPLLADDQAVDLYMEEIDARNSA